jgi:hypothetical protein
MSMMPQLQKIKSTNIDSPNKFDVTISKGLLTIEEAQLSLKSINIPQYNDESIETFFNNRWVMTRGRASIFQIQLTLRNIKSLYLYQRYLKWMNDNVNEYPIKQYVDIEVTYTGNFKGQTHKTIIFKDCLMSNLSDLAFDHSITNSTLDFSVGFKSNSMIIK